MGKEISSNRNDEQRNFMFGQPDEYNARDPHRSYYRLDFRLRSERTHPRFRENGF